MFFNSDLKKHLGLNTSSSLGVCQGLTLTVMLQGLQHAQMYLRQSLLLSKAVSKVSKVLLTESMPYLNRAIYVRTGHHRVSQQYGRDLLGLRVLIDRVRDVRHRGGKLEYLLGLL